MLIYYITLLLLTFGYLFFQKYVLVCGNRKSGQAALNRKDKQFNIFAFVLLSALMGLRSVTVGIDLLNYRYRFENAASLSNQLKWERGYSLLNYALKSLGINWQVFLILITVITVGGG